MNMKRWYLLSCKRGEQSKAKTHLENQGVECFYPMLEVKKQRRGKPVMVNEALFPGYIFVCFDYEQGPSFTSIRSTRGVVDFIRFGPHPTQVRDDLIRDLKLMDTSIQDKTDDATALKSGDKVYIQSGPFAGFDACFQEPDGEKRSIMLINMLHQPITVSIDNDDMLCD